MNGKKILNFLKSQGEVFRVCNTASFSGKMNYKGHTHWHYVNTVFPSSLQVHSESAFYFLTALLQLQEPECSHGDRALPSGTFSRGHTLSSQWQVPFQTFNQRLLGTPRKVLLSEGKEKDLAGGSLWDSGPQEPFLQLCPRFWTTQETQGNSSAA